MKRDHEKILELLIEIEGRKYDYFECEPISDLDEEETFNYYQLRLMEDAGFVKETKSKASDGGIWRMTYQGHDYLDKHKPNGLPRIRQL